MKKVFIFLFSVLSFSSWSSSIYVVQRGDNLKKISKKFYNNKICWKVIADKNKIKSSEKKLILYQKIKIPKIRYCARHLIKVSKLLGTRLDISRIKKLSRKKKTKSQNHRLDVYVSPFKFKKVNKEREVFYGTDYNYRKGMYELQILYERASYSSTDALEGFTVKSSDHKGLMKYDINKFFGDFTYFMLVTYKREREGDIYLIKHQLRGGMFGLKYDIVEEGKNLEDLSISFIPLYEYLNESVSQVDASGDVIYVDVNNKYIRNSLRLKLTLRDSDDRIKLDNIFYYRPAYNLTTKEYEPNNVDLENITKISYNINSSLSIFYKSIITWNERRKSVYRLPSTDIESSFNFSYTLKI